MESGKRVAMGLQKLASRRRAEGDLFVASEVKAKWRAKERRGC